MPQRLLIKECRRYPWNHGHPGKCGVFVWQSFCTTSGSASREDQDRARPPRSCADGNKARACRVRRARRPQRCKEGIVMKKARSESAHLLPIQELRWRCDPATLGFETTEVVSPLDGVAGQERAADAIKLALRITAPDYNVFVAGPPGTGRLAVTLDLLRAAAAARPAASDWCYLENFREPDRPVAVELPAGKGRELKADLD